MRYQSNLITCAINDCNKPYHCRGYCKSHYNQSYYGKLPRGESISDNPKLRYSRKILKTDYCWEWMGAKFAEGYGKIRNSDNKIKLAHRVIYELYKGKIPTGLSLDHLCENKSCVNPDHLEPVTHKVNIQRHHSNRNRTSCPKNHDYTNINTYVNPLGRRICRECTRVAGRKYRLKKSSKDEV